MGLELLPPVARPPRVVFVRGVAEAKRASVWTPAIPGSKYYTLRYLLNALLADGKSVVRNPAISEDTAALVGAMRALGGEVSWEREAAGGAAWLARVRGVAGRPRLEAGGAIQVGNAGAVLRLLLGIGALLPEARFETAHAESLGRRPNADLLEALGQLGVRSESRDAEGALPITLRGGGIRGGAVSISGEKSSQYLSALLYLAPLLPAGLDITVTGALRSEPLIRTTLRALARGGIRVEASAELRRFVVPGGQRFVAGEFDTPGDGPSAAALASAALVAGTPVRLDHLPTRDEDVRALFAGLHALGATVEGAEDGAGTESVTVAGGSGLRGALIDGDACIDSVPALVAAACFAEGESRFEQVATLRLKESDRIYDLCDELRRAGCDVEPHPDAIVVRGRQGGIAGGATVAVHDDHRLAQALAIVALGSRDGLTITGADAVAKSYPWFFAELASIGAEVRVVEE
jgi:3-phosphoshikimate 1-carboxyvinyltransferase